MHDAQTRLLTGAAALAVIWIVVYWVWQPGPARTLSEPGVPLEITAAREAIGASGADVDLEDAIAAVGRGELRSARQPLPAIVDPLVVDAENPVKAEADAASGAGTANEAPVVPPAFRDHTIRSGETFQTIARDAFGSSALWTAIARANPLTDPNKLRAGQVVRVPLDPRNIQGVPAPLANDDGVPAATDTAASATIEYRVRPGDALSKIAQRFYGSSRYTEFLYRANRDRLRSTSSIRAGQTILIPPKPAEP
ncbi:MAG: LysM peptidoglycan-binding domain-containing protein [Planctomycetota bacterium]